RASLALSPIPMLSPLPLRRRVAARRTTVLPTARPRNGRAVPGGRWDHGRVVDDDAANRASPPAPWHLRGGAVVSVLRVPAAQVPGLAGTVPQGHRLLCVGGDVLVGLALARYQGTLDYAEVVTAVLTRPRGSVRPHLTVPQIWVTSAASVAGARALWAIPNERFGVDLRTDRGAVRAVAT